jgi:NAD(P)H-nitrite reductase large subunit
MSKSKEFMIHPVMATCNESPYQKQKIKKVTNKRESGEYVCYCSKVTEKMIEEAIRDGADSPEKVIEATGAMKNSNCEVNNPKGT